MLVGDLIYSDDFDVNCNFEVYKGIWNDGGICVWSTIKDGHSRPPCVLLDKKIKYITINCEVPAIVIEIEE